MNSLDAIGNLPSLNHDEIGTLNRYNWKGDESVIRTPFHKKSSGPDFTG